jgi:hypothetical protein
VFLLFEIFFCRWDDRDTLSSIFQKATKINDPELLKRHKLKLQILSGGFREVNIQTFHLQIPIFILVKSRLSTFITWWCLCLSKTWFSWCNQCWWSSEWYICYCLWCRILQKCELWIYSWTLWWKWKTNSSKSYRIFIYLEIFVWILRVY